MKIESGAMYVYIATTFIATCMICNYTISEYTFDKYLGKFIREYNELKVDRSMLMDNVNMLMDDYFGDLLQQPFVHNHTLFKPMTGMTGMTAMAATNAIEVRGGGSNSDSNSNSDLIEVMYRKDDPMIIKKLREMSLKRYNANSYPHELKGFIEFLNNKKVDMGHVVKLFGKLEEDVVKAIEKLPTELKEIDIEPNITSITKIIDGIGYSQDTGHFRRKLIVAIFRKKKQLIKYKNLNGANVQKIIQRADNIYRHFLHVDADVVQALVDTRSGYVENLLNLLYGAGFVNNSVETEQAFLHAFRYLEGKNDFGIIGDAGEIGQVMVVTGEVDKIKENAKMRDVYRKGLAKKIVGIVQYLDYKDFNVLRHLLFFLDPNVQMPTFKGKNLTVREKHLFKATCVQLVRLIDKLNSNTPINTIRKGFTTKIEGFSPPGQDTCLAYLRSLNAFLTNEIYARFIYVQTRRIDTRKLHYATFEEFNGYEDRYALYKTVAFDRFKFDFVVDIYVQALLNFTDVLLEYDYAKKINMEVKIIQYLNDGKGYREKLDNVVESIIGEVEGDNLVIKHLRYDHEVEEGDDFDEGGAEWEEAKSIIYDRINNVYRIWLYLFMKVFEINVVVEKVNRMFGESVDDEDMDLKGVVDAINEGNGFGGIVGGKGKMVKKYVEGLYTCKDKKKRKAYRVVGEGNKLFVMCKGVHTRVGDVAKK